MMTNPIKDVQLNQSSHIQPNAEVQQERNQAIADLLYGNSFYPLDQNLKPKDGSWNLDLRLKDDHIIVGLFNPQTQDKEFSWELPLSSLKNIIKDYFIMTQSYSTALKAGNPVQLETIDMGRRGIHNEGAEALQNIFKNKAQMDFDTSRRLFTLICVLHIRII